MNTFFNDIFVLTIILMLGIYFIISKKLLTSIISISLVSLFAAFFYLLIGAPDVALTEAAVGSAVSTCIILAALTKYRYDYSYNTHDINKILPLFLCTILFIILCYFINELPLYGDINSIANLGVAYQYKKNLLNDIGLNSLVTGILASYRGFDTLGETLVIFTSGAAVTLILKKKNERKNTK